LASCRNSSSLLNSCAPRARKASAAWCKAAQLSKRQQLGVKQLNSLRCPRSLRSPRSGTAPLAIRHSVRSQARRSAARARHLRLRGRRVRRRRRAALGALRRGRVRLFAPPVGRAACALGWRGPAQVPTGALSPREPLEKLAPLPERLRARRTPRLAPENNSSPTALSGRGAGLRLALFSLPFVPVSRVQDRRGLRRALFITLIRRQLSKSIFRF